MTESNYPLYLLIHEHQYGPTSHPFFWTGAKAPEAMSIAEMLAIDFESEKEEFISIDGPLRIDEAPILHELEA